MGRLAIPAGGGPRRLMSWAPKVPRPMCVVRLSLRRDKRGLVAVYSGRLSPRSFGGAPNEALMHRVVRDGTPLS